ncbi:MAG: hemolysin family protein [Bryobacteraceae bacterium]
MTLLILIAGILLGLIVTAATCAQLLYLESLRVHPRELPALEFFKETLQAKIGLDTDQGSLTFTLIKHIGLAVLGVLTLALTAQNADAAEALTAAILLVAAYAVLGTYVIPQIVYRKTNGHGLVALVTLYRALALAMRPITWIIGFIESVFDLGESNKPEDAATPEEHIEALIAAGEEEGIIEKGDRKLIQSVVAFGDKTVREVMTPRPKIVSVRADATLEELRELAITEQYSRIPVFEENIDQVIGFVHVRDMFEREQEDRKLHRVREIMRPIEAVPESKPVNDLLREMQEKGSHMAVVVDEYGSTAGIVTMEDMVEEIVGEIHDEHEPERDFREEPDGSYVVSGSFDVGRLENLLDYQPTEDTESTTVGGLVTEWLGHVPAAGEEIERDGIAIRVLSANHVRVDQVRVAKASAK